MHETPFTQRRTDLEGLDLDRTALDVELRGKLTGRHQCIVEPDQRHISVQLRQVGGIFHVQVRHESAPADWQKDRTYIPQRCPVSGPPFSGRMLAATDAAPGFPKRPPTSPRPWSAPRVPIPKTAGSTPAATTRSATPGRPDGTTAVAADPPSPT